jgi:hypothetical protein
MDASEVRACVSAYGVMLQFIRIGAMLLVKI